jgi:hypothetical protein
MAKLTDSDIKNIIEAEERQAIDYEGEISETRAKLMDYYNCVPYGDEVEGQSSAISSDVADTVETLMPGLMRVFTQGRLIGVFESDEEAYDEEAEHKTELANHVFLKQNNGFLALNTMFKDALLQLSGTVKVYWDETENSDTTKYCGLSEEELKVLEAEEDVTVDDVEKVDDGYGGVTYNANKVTIKKKGCVKVDNIPPEEFLISRTARNFVDRPSFIGH